MFVVSVRGLDGKDRLDQMGSEIPNDPLPCPHENNDKSDTGPKTYIFYWSIVYNGLIPPKTLQDLTKEKSEKVRCL